MTLLAQQNDQFRITGSGGVRQYSEAIAQLGDGFIDHVIQAVIDYHDFEPDSHHDRGRLVVEGQEVVWQISYLDKAMTCISPDPCDEDVTSRMLIIALAEE